MKKKVKRYFTLRPLRRTSQNEERETVSDDGAIFFCSYRGWAKHLYLWSVVLFTYLRLFACIFISIN
jgi:hypothetical protein